MVAGSAVHPVRGMYRRGRGSVQAFLLAMLYCLNNETDYPNMGPSPDST